jgi:hypothetical protein
MMLNEMTGEIANFKFQEGEKHIWSFKAMRKITECEREVFWDIES